MEPLSVFVRRYYFNPRTNQSVWDDDSNAVFLNRGGRHLTPGGRDGGAVVGGGVRAMAAYDAIVFGTGLWDVEYGTAAAWVEGVLRLAAILRPHMRRGRLFFMLMPSTNGGPSTVYRSRLRVEQWNKLAALTLPKHGVNVLDPFHLTDGRLEKSDHTHFGFWAEKESGITNPTLSAQTVNVLLNYLCAKDKFEPQGGGDDNR